jgi:ribosome biogenesis GTPase A
MVPIKPEPVDGVGLAAGFAPSFNKVDVKPKVQHTEHLQQLVSATSPDVLEKGVGIALEALASLRGPLEAIAPLSTTQASQWLKTIDELKSRSKPTRTIVGVVGNTGAGKSSVISAVLDEERYVAPYPDIYTPITMRKTHFFPVVYCQLIA